MQDNITLDDIPGQPNTKRAVIQELTGGWSTRTYPHLLPANYLTVATNVCYYRDGLVSKRPGNVFYGNGTGKTGTNLPIKTMARYYPYPSPAQLIVQSGTQLFKGNDTTGTFTPLASSYGFTGNCNYQQMYDPDSGALQLFIVDGVHIPVMLAASGTATQVLTGSSPASALATSWLPNAPAGSPITPAYVCEYQYHLVYAGEPTDPTALYISDALRPQRFNGYSVTDSAGTQYTQYYPAGRDSSLGIITGILPIGANLIIFYTNGIVAMSNSGTYGSTQYTFNRISGSIGCKSPRSIINMDNYAAFFGGDKFWATDGATFLAPLPDELPTAYANTNKSVRPPLIKNNTTVFGVRHEDEMLFSYDSTGLGPLDTILMFDVSAQGGWTPGSLRGGAWALWQGMPMECAVECRGLGDNFQLFWGSSTADTVAQHDVILNTASASGGYADFGQPIAMEIRTKSFLFDKPAHVKSVHASYVMAAFDTLPTAYSVSTSPYIFFDSTQVFSTQPVQFNIASAGTLYGSGSVYGSGVLYESSQLTYQQTSKSYFGNGSMGQSISPGIIESSIYPLNIYGFVIEVTTDQPQP